MIYSDIFILFTLLYWFILVQMIRDFKVTDDSSN